MAEFIYSIFAFITAIGYYIFMEDSNIYEAIGAGVIWPVTVIHLLFEVS